MAKIIMDENETVNEAVEVENTEAPELDADFSVDADSVENTSTDTEPPTDGSGIDTDMSVETPEETTPTDKEESSDNTQTEGNPDENIDNSVDDGISSLPLEDTDLKPVYDEPTGQADSVGTGKKWTDGYAIKTKASDDDEAMILSTSEKANKRIKFSGIWDWIVDKMANAVVSKLTTTDKTVLGAINELNSNTSNLIFVRVTDNFDGKTADIAAQYIIDNKLPEYADKFFFVSFTAGSRCNMIVQKYSTKDYASYILFGYAEDTISYHRKVNGGWK